MYTLREFRANTKQAFDDSAEGHEVVIRRGSQSFQLVCLVDKPLPGHSFESVPEKAPELIERCNGTHYMTREDCGKPGCPWR